MAVHAYNAVDDTQALRDSWDKEFGLNPTEETKIADWVARPVGSMKVGRSLLLRKLPAVVAQTFTDSATAGQLTELTSAQTALEVVTATSVMKYGLVTLSRAILNRAVEDGALRAGFRKQLSAGVREAVDIALFALGSSASASESGASVDDAMVRSALGQLATNAKGKFSEDSPKLLVVHPNQLANVWNIPAIKEYQIRGTIGAAVNAKLNAYGLIWRESGNVQQSGGVVYNPLLLKDGWALAFNEEPHIIDVQFDGLNENFIGVTEYAVAEWFDSSVVTLNTAP